MIPPGSQDPCNWPQNLETFLTTIGRSGLVNYPDRHELHYELLRRLFGAPFDKPHFLLVDTLAEAYEPIFRSAADQLPILGRPSPRLVLLIPAFAASSQHTRARDRLLLRAYDSAATPNTLEKIAHSRPPDLQVERRVARESKSCKPQQCNITTLKEDSRLLVSPRHLARLAHANRDALIVAHQRPSLRYQVSMNAAIKRSPNLLVVHEFPTMARVSDRSPCAALLGQPDLLIRLQALNYIVWYNMDAANTMALTQCVRSVTIRPRVGRKKLCRQYRSAADWARRRTRMDFNETRSQDSSEILDALRAYIPHMNQCEAERRALIGLGQRFNLDSKRFLLFRGANHAIKRIMFALASAGDTIILPDVTYIGHVKAALASGARVKYSLVSQTSTGNPLSLHCSPWRLLEAAMTCHAKVICLCNPSNPLGEAIPADVFDTWLNALCDALPSAVIVVDACFHRYGEALGLDMPNYARLTDLYPVVVIGSVSKEDGYAGVRAGYAYGTADIIQNIRSSTPFAQPIPILGSATLALSTQPGFQDQAMRTIRANLQESERIRTDIQNLGNAQTQSIAARNDVAAGFNVLSFGPLDITLVRTWLRDLHSIEVSVVPRFSQFREDLLAPRPTEVEGIPEPGLLRVSTGVPAENDRLLEGLHQIAWKEGISATQGGGYHRG